MAVPTDVNRSRRLEEQDKTLTSLKLILTDISSARPTLLALRDSKHLRQLSVQTGARDEGVGLLIREALLPNASLQKLSLDLKECSDEGGARHLASLLQGAGRNLQEMALSLNAITENGAAIIAKGLAASKLRSFSIYATQLDLYDRSIGDAGAAHFAQVLSGRTQNLSAICIAQNSITNIGLSVLLDAIASNPRITSLDLHANAIDHAGVANIAAYLSSENSSHKSQSQAVDTSTASMGKPPSSPGLVRLVLDENRGIGSEGARSLALALCRNATLQVLSLRSCNIGEKGAERFATTLKENSTLRELVLCGNVNIGDNAVELMSRGLQGNRGLRRLDLSSCGIGDEGCAHLADAMATNSCLTHLSLHRNGISDGGVLALSQALTSNTALSSLVLTDNQFTERGTNSLLQSLEHNSFLCTLTLAVSGRGKGSSSREHQEKASMTSIDVLLSKNRELVKCRTRIRELETQVQQLSRERDTLRERLNESSA